MDYIRFIYNNKRLKLLKEEIEEKFLQHIENILQPGYNMFLQEIEFTDEELITQDGINSGQYNLELKKITIRDSEYIKVIATFIHELFHVRFAINYLTLYNRLDYNNKIGYGFINEYEAVVKTGIYLIGIENNLFMKFIIDEVIQNIEFINIKNKNHMVKEEYKDILFSMDYDDETLDKKLRELDDSMYNYENFSAYQQARAYAKEYLRFRYLKLDISNAEDEFFKYLSEILNYKLTEDICNKVYCYLIDAIRKSDKI